MSPAPEASAQSQTWLRLLIVGGLLWFAFLGVRPLFNPDEGRYAEIPAAMLATHQWVVPHLNGFVYLEKPPLQYWLTAASLAAFGHNEWAARLVTAGSGACTVWLVYLLGARAFSRSRGLYAAAMVSSMLLFAVMSQLITLDMLLCATLTLSTVSFCLAQMVRDENPATCRRWMLLCWVGMAAATLTKGLIGVVIPGGVLVLYTVLQRDWAVWRHLALGRGLALFLALVLPWFLLVEHAQPGALHFLIIHEHFQRYLSTVHERYQPPWYFLMILGAGSLPWLPQVARALILGWRTQTPSGSFDVNRVLWMSAAFTLVFFSLSDSKLAPYIVPVLPPLALLGSGLDAPGRLDLNRAAWLQIVLAIGLGVGLAVYSRHALSADPAWTLTQITPWVLATIGLMLIGGTIAQRLALRQPTRAAHSLAVSSFLSIFLLIIGGASAISLRYSVKPLLDRAGPRTRGAPIYTVNGFDWTLPFYTEQAVIPVNYQGELDYGLKLAPERALATVEQFVAIWQILPAGYALIPKDEAAHLSQAGLPMRVLAEDFNNVWVSRQ
jgi:4-amino-4-deoxy-L-arabinose transferase-like glycosyltransferase